MIIQEPIKATISFALENFAYSDAIFLSERLHAEVSTDESLFLLANSYYRSGKSNVAYALLTEKHTKICHSPQCLFLLSKSCFDLKKFNEALDTLTQPFFNNQFSLEKDSPKLISREELIQYFGELSSFVAQLLGGIYVKLDCTKHAAHYYAISLKINPFLWNSYEKLVQIDPSAVESNKLISPDNFEFKYSCGTNPLINLLNSSNSPILTSTQQQTTTHTATLLSDNTNTSHTFQTPQQQQQPIQSFPQATNVFKQPKFEISTPFAVIKQSNENCNKLDVITPETNGNWHTISCLAPSKNQNNNTPGKVINRKVTNAALKSLNNNSDTLNSNQNGNVPPPINTVVSRNLQSYWDSSSLQSRHSFGVLRLDEQSLALDDLFRNETNNTRGNNRDGSSPAPIGKKPYTRRNIQQDLDINMIDMSSNLNTNSPTGALRRSSRLYSHANWVKENTTNTKASKINTRTPTKRSRRTISYDKNSDQKDDLGKSDENLKVITSIDLTKAGIKVQRTSAIGLLELMAKFGLAYKMLSEFKCREAIEEFQNFPAKHLNTGFVLSSIGRAYFEMGKYDEAISYFKKCRQIEPYRLQGMEIYSTALWHQQKEVELSCLSQTLIDFDKLAPETWCVAGNCFSLQKEHEISIKFLKRAIQVDPDFSYAYTLLGHELVSADELDNAMACFRNATRIEPRHYNAWYGIGMIFYKQEKYLHAYNNYKRALDISPFNPVLMCHLAIVCHHMKKSKRAIELLEKASKLDPANALVKFHRASIHFATEKYALAMDELEQLKQIVPKESMVYFLIGKIHKIQGETHLALMNFSWAMDLDPKGANNQIKELIDRHYGNEDEIMIHSNTNQMNGAAPNGTPGSDGAYMTSMIVNTPNNHPFLPRSTLTPTGTGVPGTSGSTGGSGASTSATGSANSSNGSNNSNNISNNNAGSSAQIVRLPGVSTVRRIGSNGGIGEEDASSATSSSDDEDEDEEEFDNSELVDSTNLTESVSFHMDNNDNPDANFDDDDNFML